MAHRCGIHRHAAHSTYTHEPSMQQHTHAQRCIHSRFSPSGASVGLCPCNKHPQGLTVPKPLAMSPICLPVCEQRLGSKCCRTMSGWGCACSLALRTGDVRLLTWGLTSLKRTLTELRWEGDCVKSHRWQLAWRPAFRPQLGHLPALWFHLPRELLELGEH